MKRKAIEKIEPAKTRKKGHIATVQTLDDIAIINVFNDKVLAVRYCINCKTGEHEYWTEKNGWKKGKSLEKCMAQILKVSFETKTQLDDRIVRAAGLKPPIYLGIPGKAQIRKIAEKYYKGEEK